ncbi:MAG: 6-pyruvoyl tetrahydropterin synthase family protein [Nitrospiria bacterium]
MYTVTREINFCYGHRLLNYPGKCRHLHGHNGRVEIEIYAEKLDALGMVRDFEEIKEIVESWITQHIDHKMILCRKDPIIPVLKTLDEAYILVNENPTAEVIAKMIYDYAQTQGLPVSEVRLWENDRSCAAYRK